MDQKNDAYLSDIWFMLDEKMRENYQYTEESYTLWFGRMKLVYLDADKAVFVCENKTKKDIISKRFVEFISTCLNDVIGYAPGIEIEVDESLAPVIPNEEGIISPVEIIKERQAQQNKERQQGYSQPKPPVIHTETATPEYREEIHSDLRNTEESRDEKQLAYTADFTFENFIVGTSNRFAHAAALNVSDNIGTTINPLFIWGPSGLGKTHLMYAIANRALKRNPNTKVLYVKGEEFTNQLVEAIQKGKTQQFKQKYRSVDILLVDDIQFIAGKEATQTEFFHTFDALYEDKKQIILTSDRPPKELTALEDRIRSRFEAGLLADIQPPDYELRLAILKNKINQNDLDVPMDVLDFLAQNLSENIRQLDGVIKKLTMIHLLSGQPITMEMALGTLSDIIREAEPVSETVDRIIASTARHCSVSVEDIMGNSRKKEIKNARNISMYIVRSLTGLSFPQIGLLFNRDHSTVHSNVNMIESELLSDPVLEALINEISKEIKR